MLKEKYPAIEHSGCAICPVLVLFSIKGGKSKKQRKRYVDSLKYAIDLGVVRSRILDAQLSLKIENV